MALDPREIAKQRGRFEICEMMSYEETCKEIAKESSSVILPVIINIIEEIQTAELSNLKDELLCNVIKGLKAYDEMQGLAKSFSFSQIWTVKSKLSTLLSEVPKDIKSDLNQLVLAVKEVEIKSEAIPLWYEAASWLNGFYLRASQTETSYFHNMVDIALKMAIELNQLEIAGYYQKIASAMIDRLLSRQEAKETSNPAFLFNKNIPPSSPPNERRDSEKGPAIKFQ